jgi:hypothetical protein
MKYTNGNANIWLDLRDGTRIIEYPDNEQLTLKTPLNIDIRVSTQCPYGYDTTKQKSTCTFCHESALVNGQECDYGILQQVLIDANLPRGTEIALGVNEVIRDLIQFVKNLWKLGLVVNVTMNERYIDHQSYGMISESLFKTKEDLITYLFNDNLVIYIENDNDDYQEWYTGERHND